MLQRVVLERVGGGHGTSFATMKCHAGDGYDGSATAATAGARRLPQACAIRRCAKMIGVSFTHRGNIKPLTLSNTRHCKPAEENVRCLAVRTALIRPLHAVGHTHATPHPTRASCCCCCQAGRPQNSCLCYSLSVPEGPQLAAERRAVKTNHHPARSHARHSRTHHPNHHPLARSLAHQPPHLVPGGSSDAAWREPGAVNAAVGWRSGRPAAR